MQLIHAALPAATAPSLPRVALQVSRLHLAKRRWRGFAEDGKEFGFDLEAPLPDGALFFATPTHLYAVQQLPEPVVDIRLPSDPSQAARIGWLFGNLHFPVALLPGALRIQDDPAVRQLLARESLEHSPSEAVFYPLSGGHSHGH